MAMCPACDHEVRTPFVLNLDGWSHLTCTQCKARLEMKPPRFAIFAPLMAPLFVLARQGRVFEIVAFVFMFATIFLLILESIHPRVQLRKRPLPEPEIRLTLAVPQIRSLAERSLSVRGHGPKKKEAAEDCRSTKSRNTS